MVEIKVTSGMPAVGMKLKDISNKISSSILIGAVLREDEVIIPNGEFEIRGSDMIYIIGRPSECSISVSG